jgi:hypothetical protein
MDHGGAKTVSRFHVQIWRGPIIAIGPLLFRMFRSASRRLKSHSNSHPLREINITLVTRSLM